ncbi:MAG: DNA polymerase III subunit gamma/tau [Desulfuromonadaceae bacterium]|nr:DNA polymerase III subunit gamma/tau [Desulfuromonadaceae bacterium]
MSYQVLALKWRPALFADLVGQEHVSRTLTNAINNGRVHHAFVFTGARGVGKTSAARILAKALNCRERQGAEPCNACDSCREITANQHDDVIEIDGASNNGVENVRELREMARYMPASAPFKIIIIDEVHMLSISAFNALLKILEEPPAHVKFIFATTEPHKIPVTILSRCQRFDFRKITHTKVVAQLERIATAEGVEISARALRLIAEAGGGSMRDSLSTFDQILAFCSAQVEDADVMALLGVVDRRLVLDALEGCVGRQPSQVFEVVRRVDEAGYSFRTFCQALIETLRTLILTSVIEDAELHLGISADEVTEFAQLDKLGTAEDWQRLLSILIKVETEISASAYPRLLVEMALIRAASLPPARMLADVVRKLEQIELSSGNAAAVPAGPGSSGTGPRSQPAQFTPQSVPPSAPLSPTQASQYAQPQPAPQAASAVQDNSIQYGSSLADSQANLAPVPPPPDSPPPADEPEQEPLVTQSSISSSEVGGTDSSTQGWEELVRYVGKKNPRIGALLDNISLLELAPPVLRLGAAGGSFLMQQLKDKETCEKISALAQTFTGQKIVLKVEALAAEQVTPSLQQSKQQQESDRSRKLRDDAVNHPIVRQALEIFAGKVVDVTPNDKGYV